MHHSTPRTDSTDTDATAPIVRLEKFGVSLGSRVILADVSFELPPRTLVALLGPVGSGKSTLLRTLTGLNDGHPSLRRWGAALLLGAPIADRNRPALVVQSAKLMLGTVLDNLLAHEPHGLTAGAARRERARAILEEASLGALADRLDQAIVELSSCEQRCVSIARTCVPDPAALFVDEPTAGLSDADADTILSLLEREATRRSVLFVTHRIDQARGRARQVMLLAGGRVVDQGPSPLFFDAPATELARQFVRTGSCSTPSPDARAEDLDEGTQPPPPLPPEAQVAPEDERGPRGFRWLVTSQLAGCARPGLLGDLDDDIAALSRLGVSVLVTLEEQAPPREVLARAGIESVHVPIADMQAPSVVTALDLSESIDRWLAEGRAVCVHCRAGLGRTGTILVAWLIHRGESGPAALERARAIERYWVESDAQLEFLDKLWAVVAEHS